MMFQTFINFACLAAEANLVVGLRLHRICLGGISARDESMLMVPEKVDASRDAFFHMAAGCSLDSLVSDHRNVVQAKARWLSA